MASILNGFPVKEYANHKARELAKRLIPPVFTRPVRHKGQVRNLRIEIKQIKTLMVGDRVFLEVQAEAWEGLQQLAVDNPLQFLNPPIRISTGNKLPGVINRPDGPVVVEVDETVEDLDESLKQIVTEAIRVTCLS